MMTGRLPAVSALASRVHLRAAVVVGVLVASASCAGEPDAAGRSGSTSATGRSTEYPARAQPLEPAGAQVIALAPDTGSREGGAEQGSPKLAAAFGRVLDSVRVGTRVPLRIPRVAWGDATDDSIRVSVTELDADRYELVLGAAEVDFCGGGTYCRTGTVAGERRAPGAPALVGESVPLPGGRTGYFADATCGANCPDSHLRWDEGPYRYSVGLKIGDRDELQRMAASSIPRN